MPFHAVQILTLVMLSLFAIASVQAEDLPTQNPPAQDLPAQDGGPGADVVVAECPAGEHLVGVSLKAGALVDAVQPLCAPFLAAQRKFGEWTRGTPEDRSGVLPLLKDGACPADRYIHAIAVRFADDTKQLDHVVLFCSPIINRSAATTVCVSSGPKKCAAVTSFDQSCSAGEAATGFHLSHNAEMDSLGLICGPRPTVFVGPKPTSAGEPKPTSIDQPTPTSIDDPTPSPVGVPTPNSAGEPKHSRREIYEKLKKYREKQTSFGEPTPTSVSEPQLSRRERYERFKKYREQRAN
jgi:hypothetical protein